MPINTYTEGQSRYLGSSCPTAECQGPCRVAARVTRDFVHLTSSDTRAICIKWVALLHTRSEYHNILHCELNNGSDLEKLVLSICTSGKKALPREIF